MTSARSGQTISGAAQGAAIGSQVFPGWGTIIGGAIGGVAGYISGSSSDAQFSNQMAWAQYNAQSQYNTSVYNINSSLFLAGMGAALGLSAGRYNSQQVLNTAYYDANMIGLTVAYNNSLLENELTRTWTNLNLDLGKVEMYRQRERGAMVADQGASGTVIGDGSNAVVVMNQMTQEAMDVSLLQFGADRQAANISNEIAQGTWEGNVAIQQTMWKGQVQANSIMFNAKLQAAGTVMGAVIQADAGMYNAKQAYMTAGYNQQQAASQYGFTQTQAMTQGLFQAAGTATAGYYANKVPKSLATRPSGVTPSPAYSPNWGSNVYLGNSAPTNASQLLTGGLNR